MERVLKNRLERRLVKAVWDAVQADPETRGLMDARRMEPIKAYIAAIVDVLAEPD